MVIPAYLIERFKDLKGNPAEMMSKIRELVNIPASKDNRILYIDSQGILAHSDKILDSVAQKVSISKPASLEERAAVPEPARK